MGSSPVTEFLPDGPALTVDPLLAAIANQAALADQTRTVSADVISMIKASPTMRLSASTSIGGEHASVLQIGRELEAVAARCTSTAWVLWNHLAVFHLFVGTLGPAHSALLKQIVSENEWVCFPAGAGSGVAGVIDGDDVILNGKGSFSSGGRYADWAGVVFAVCDADGKRVEPLDIRFTIVPLADPNVRIDPTWDGSSVRASATDDIHYENVRVPLDRCADWFGANRAETLRSVPVVDHRYREDWVGLSDVWLGWMGVGLVRAALADAAEEIRSRKAILGKAMVSRPTVQVNLGRASSLVAAAAATMEAACREIDERITAEIVPTDADYLRQVGLATSALDQLRDAMTELLSTQGGNGLRESGHFERRWRDFQAMPLHINAHRDRAHHQIGRFVLGEDLEPF
jgi:3-hydroxy-9,10-secoandrosta-1,3,5(10)-triene-9,17-dione monooxygenase